MLWIISCSKLVSKELVDSSKTIIESISMGRPVITSDVPGCNNIITNNFNGLLIKPKDYDDLVKKIIKFKNLSIDKKKLMTKNCREIAISNFDVFEINKKIIDETINNQ